MKDVCLENVLFEVIRQGDIESVQQLLQDGIDPNAWAGSPLIEAVESGQKEIIDCLIAAGAIVDPFSEETLITAARLNLRSIFTRLLEAGARHPKALMLAIKKGWEEEALILTEPREEDDREEALVHACMQGLHRLCLKLVKEGTDPRCVLDQALTKARRKRFDALVFDLEVACVHAELLGS